MSDVMSDELYVDKIKLAYHFHTLTPKTPKVSSQASKLHIKATIKPCGCEPTVLVEAPLCAPEKAVCVFERTCRILQRLLQLHAVTEKPHFLSAQMLHEQFYSENVVQVDIIQGNNVPHLQHLQKTLRSAAAIFSADASFH